MEAEQNGTGYTQPFSRRPRDAAGGAGVQAERAVWAEWVLFYTCSHSGPREGWGDGNLGHPKAGASNSQLECTETRFNETQWPGISETPLFQRQTFLKR